MIREEILQDLESFTAGLDDTFKFHCTQCGKCCIERDDIMLSPMDIFKIAKELKLSPHAFFYKYCTRVIGTHSRVPIVMLRPVGKNHRCPLLKNNKCAVHNVKPAVCGMFPLGRYIVLSPENYNKEGFADSEVKYLLQPIECGDDSETHTVREWLSGFDISLEDKAFVRWHQAIAEIGSVLQTLEKKWDPFTMMEVWFVVQITLYQNYDTKKDFMPQLEENIAGVLDILQDIPRIKEAVRRATRAYCNIRFRQDILEIACWGQNEAVQLTLHRPEELLRALEDGCSIDNLAQMLMVQMECTYDEAVALIKLMVQRRILE